jgi:GH24 family phage-related lysozyme (muramidase)
MTGTDAYAQFRQDLNTYVSAVNKDVTITLSQTLFDALVIFTFNVGTHAFGNSTLLKAINNNRLDVVTNFQGGAIRRDARRKQISSLMVPIVTEY